MATMLIWAKDDRDPDQGYRKGAVVVVQDDPAVWGSSDGLPDFVRLTISDQTAEEVNPYLEVWRQLIQWEVTTHNANLDRYDVRIWTPNKRTSDGRGGITLAQVESWLAGWSISVLSSSAGEVNVRFRVRDVAGSQAFLGASPEQIAQVTMSEVSYDQGTGEHVGRIEYPVGWPGLKVEERISAHAEVLSHDLLAGVIEFRVFRDDVLAFLRAEARDELDQIIGKRRWYFDPASIDQLITAGGVVTRTAAQVASALKNAQAD